MAQYPNTKLTDNVNFLSPIGFKMNVKTLPNVSYFCQRVSIPDISMGNAIQPTPFVDIPIPGDKIVYSDLSVEFIVDEDMTNWKELYDWINILGYPDNTSQYSHSDRYTDIDINILTSNMNGKYKLTFYDAFPISLSSIPFDSTASDVEYITVTADFKFKMYDFKNQT